MTSVLPVADDADPPRKNYGFKERAFKRDNRRASSAPPMPTATDLAKLAGGPVVSGAPKNAPRAGDPNDVHAVLAHNREVEKQFGGDAVKLTRTGSRKKRDYWLVFVSLEVVFGGVVALGVKQSNPFFLVFGLTGMVVFGIAITWIMWQLVDRY
jgi:hypothetical protein